MQWTYPLDRVDLSHIQQVGGKAARLGAMSQAGFVVPEGFVIPADAFLAHFPDLNVTERPAPPRVDPELVAQVAAAVRDAFPQGTMLAVRSSAIDEDSATASFAGQHETYYFISEDNLVPAIVDCWLSAWSDAALTYRAQWGDGVEPLAVIVQRLVKADRSGVSFSRDPVNSQDTRTVIESTWGLGAALVDGRVTPDRVHVDQRGRVTCSQIGDKQLHVPADRGRAERGRLASVDNQDRFRRSLSDDDARHIAETTEQIEELFGHPVDVEWAFQEGALELLQARPITTILTNGEPDEKLVLFKPIAENFSEPLTPMSEDLFSRVLPRIGSFANGHLYIDFNLARRLLPFKLNEGELADLLLLKNTSQPRIALSRLPLTLLMLAGFYLTNGVFWHRSAHLTERSLERVREVINEVRDNTRLNVPRALKRLLQGSHPFQAMHHFIFQINVSAGRHFVLLGLLRRVLDRWAPGFDQDAIPSLCHGGNDMFSTRMVESIARLATLANEDPECLAALTGPDPLQQLSEMDAGHPFMTRLHDFLCEFGHRGSREIELAAPRFQEDVAALLPMIRSQLERDVEAPDLAYARHLAARDQLHQALPSRWKRRLIDALVRRIRYYIVLRENTRHYHTMIFALVREKLLAFESDLLARGALRVAGDIFFLTWEETERLASGDLQPVQASQLVRERRISWRAAANRPPPDRYNIEHTTSADANAGLRGTCACPGTASGTARVIMRPDEADRLRPGDILIAPYTDPTWTPLFPSLGGIVVGIGSYLSHAGTVAREYQIPCIVDVSGCTELIPDGAAISMDATRGLVRQEEPGA